MFPPGRRRGPRCPTAPEQSPGVQRPPTETPWPLVPAAARTPPRAIDRPALRAVLEATFQEAEPQRPMRTRAVVVVRDGWVVAERYAPGIAAGTPLIGWSMAKSLTHALVGIAVADGLLATDRPVPVPEWSSSDDPRRAITLDLLLRMRSGLAFSEVYDDFSSDVITMLLRAPDAGAFAASKPLTAAPWGGVGLRLRQHQHHQQGTTAGHGRRQGLLAVPL